MIEDLAGMLEARAESLAVAKRYMEAYEAMNCALAIRRAA